MKRLSLLFFLFFFTSQAFAGPVISPTAPSKVIKATSVTATGNIQASTYGSGANPIPDATLLGIDDGLTTQILVGGGGNTKPEWGTDLPTAITIGTKYIYRADGTDVPVADGGTGASTLTDGGVLLGSGTGAITAMSVLTDGQIIVGDGTGDPVAESGDTARISLGVGSTDSPTFAGATVQGPTGTGTATAGILTLATKETTVVATDELGRINFNAPLEASGTDAILPGASIWAVAEDTFAADNNKTSLVFATGSSEAAVEKAKIDSNGMFHFEAGQTVKKTNVSDTAYGTSALTSDYIVSFTSLTASRAAVISSEDVASGTATQPRIMIFKDESGDAGTYPITISLENAGTINGNATKTINTPYGSATIYLNGTNGFTINN